VYEKNACQHGPFGAKNVELIYIRRRYTQQQLRRPPVIVKETYKVAREYFCIELRLMLISKSF
jgi:hypothetical protein